MVDFRRSSLPTLSADRNPPFFFFSDFGAAPDPSVDAVDMARPPKPLLPDRTDWLSCVPALGRPEGPLEKLGAGAWRSLLGDSTAVLGVVAPSGAWWLLLLLLVLDDARFLPPLKPSLLNHSLSSSSISHPRIFSSPRSASSILSRPRSFCSVSKDVRISLMLVSRA